MISVKKNELKHVLMSLGVSSGRTIFVHSSLGMIFGKQKDPNKFLYDCLNEIVGDSGTIVVPTFTNNCCHGLTFDPNKTESEVGVFSNWIMKLNNAKRSLHPIHSVSAIGDKADEITQQVSESSFGKKSTFSKLIELNTLMLMVGTGVEITTLIHQVEEDMQVPYRYYKNFKITTFNNGVTKQTTTPYYARFLDRCISYRYDIRRKRLENNNQYRSIRVGWGNLSSINFIDFYEIFSQEVNKDPYYLINKEKYIESI